VHRIVTALLIAVVLFAAFPGAAVAAPPAPGFLLPLPGRRPVTAIVDHAPQSNVIVAWNGLRAADAPDDPRDVAWPAAMPGPGIAGDWGVVGDLRWSFKPGWLWYDGHNGTDYSCVVGTPVAAAAPGVAYVHADGLRVDHGGGWETRYLHLSRRDVAHGEVVAAGQRIGLSGTANTGPHLHFEIRRDDVPVDPYGWEAGVLWAGGEPVPAGYRDGSGAVHGPFALDTALYASWRANAARLGAPVTDARQLNGCVEQAFERGSVYRCSGGEGVAFNAVTLLPLIDEQSSVTMRNTGNTAARVNLAIYDADGRVLESRSHHLPTGATWEARVATLLGPTLKTIHAFEGAAVVATDGALSVSATMGTTAYGGIPARALPSHVVVEGGVVRVQNAGRTGAPVTALYGPCRVERWVQPFGATDMTSEECPPVGWHGHVEVETRDGVPLAVKVR
jgi:murein DD-endopeptidase MepM/ murein hydrolase activator NlpD